MAIENHHSNTTIVMDPGKFMVYAKISGQKIKEKTFV